MYNDLKEMLKDAKNIATGASDLQLKSLLLDIQGEIYELQDENRRLRLENEELKNVEIDMQALEYKDDAYYLKGRKDHIYCPRCLDKDKVMINMGRYALAFTKNYNAKCPECNTDVETSIPHNIDWGL